MPSTIPYEASLSMGSVVSVKALEQIKVMADAQGPVNEAQGALKSLLASRRSFEMTKIELANLGIPPTQELDDNIKQLNASIVDAEKTVNASKLVAESLIREARDKLRSADNQTEPLIDHNKSQIKPMPLATASINIEYQYFAKDTYGGDYGACAAAISTFVSSSISHFNQETQIVLAGTAQKQASKQLLEPGIIGTFVFSISCTHKNALLFAPFALDIVKGVKTWNQLFSRDELDTTNKKALLQAVTNPTYESNPNKLSIISGTTFGSSFVGMVHIQDRTGTVASVSLSDMAITMQQQMESGAWVAGASGDSRITASFSQDIKHLFKSHDITSQATFIRTGIIPSTIGNKIDEIMPFNPSSSIEVSDDRNTIMGIDSLVTAIEDHCNQATTGAGGVPINYYLKDINKSMLAQMWIAKHMPGELSNSQE